MNFNEFLIEKNLVNERWKPLGLSIEETEKVAKDLAAALAKVDGVKFEITKGSLEPDAFDLDRDGVKWDGGSYTINNDKTIVNNAVPGGPVYGKVGDSVDKMIKTIKSVYESVTNESKLNLGLSTNNYPAGTIGRYRIESTVINLRKVANLSKDSWSKYSRAFTDSEIGFEKSSDRKEALAAIQKSFDNGQNDIREFELNESLVNESKVVLDTTEPDDKYLVDFCKKHGIKMKEVNPNGPADFAEYEYSGSTSNLKKMIDEFWEDDYLHSLIESVVTEGFENSAIQKALKDCGYDLKQSDFKLSKKKQSGAVFYYLNGEIIGNDDYGYDMLVQKATERIKENPKKYGLNESVVTEASAFMAKDVNKTVDFLNDETGGNPGYLFFGEDDDIEKFDKLWKSRRYQVALDMLAQDREIEAQSLEDIKLFIKESVVNERNITIKRQYTDKSPAVTVGKAAKVRNRMLEAIKDGKISQEEFNTILKEMTTDSKRWLRRNAQCFNVSEDGISLSKTGARILKNVMVSEATEKNPKIWVPGGFDKAIAKYPNQKITRKIVLDAALKWDVNPEDAIQYVEYGWAVDLDENKNNNNMKTKFIYESFQDFVANRLNEGNLNEAFKSSKLANLFAVGSAGTKDLAGAFYNFSKLAIDKIEDYDIIEMDPQTARKEKRANGIYFYVVNNQKENPYIQGSNPSTYNNGIIQSNTLLAITNGNNEWYSTAYNNYTKGETLKITNTREDAAGFDKRDSKRYDGSGITSLTKVAELADIAYVIDLDVLKARYSTTSLTAQRAADKSGAIAFQSDKDFKAANKARYNQILAQKASEMPMDSIVLGAIDTLATQIKDALTKAEKGRYGELIIGLDPRGREIKMSDASNLMKNILDEYNRYVAYAVDIEKEAASGYSGKFYEGRMKESSKTIVDYVKKVEAKNYAW